MPSGETPELILAAAVAKLGADLADLKATTLARTAGGAAGDTAWRTIGAAGQPAWQHGWAPFDTVVQFRRTRSGLVIFRGAMKDGTGNPDAAFTLPAGYRLTGVSGADQRFPVLANGLLGWVSVFPGGEVKLVAGSNTWVDLSSVVFLAEQ